MKRKNIILIVLLCIFTLSIFALFSKNKYEKDMNYFIETLKNNYPYSEQLEIEEDYFMELAKKCKNNEDFYNLVDSMIESYNGLGHLYLLNAEEYYSHLVIYNEAKKRNEISIDNDNLRILNNKSVRSVYDTLSSMTGITYDMVESSFKEGQQGYDDDNVSFQIQDDIMIIKIDSFDYSLVDSDIKKIKKELKKFNGTKLAFDIRENAGGADEYWVNLVEMTSLYDYQTKMEIKGRGDLSLSYVKKEWGEKNIKVSKTDFTYTLRSDIKSKHLYNFDEIYIFTSDKNFSSSDSFVKFAKESGYATTIGKETRGSGGDSLNPMLIELPNSHLVFRMDAVRGNEVNTKPDIDNAKDNLSSFISIINKSE